MPKGIRKVNLNDAAARPVSAGVQMDTGDMAEPKVSSAVADKDHLVTSSMLELPTDEAIVLANEAAAKKDYLAQLKFNEEPVGIVIAEDSSEFPIDPVPLGVNGKTLYLKRGQEYTIPRKFVESLCSPVTRVSTKRTLNNLGEDATQLEQTRSFQFPFRITHDPSPHAKTWFNSLMQRSK